MDQVVPALVAASAPIFGREMDRPQFTVRPIRDGKVEVGTPTVVEPSQPPSPKTDGKPSASK